MEGCDEDRRPKFLAYSSKQKAKTLVANIAQEQGLIWLSSLCVCLEVSLDIHYVKLQTTQKNFHQQKATMETNDRGGLNCSETPHLLYTSARARAKYLCLKL